MPLRIRVQDVTLVVDGARLLDSVDFEATAGELVAVVGPNGAGKTSLLRLLAGLLKPRTGVVYVDGRVLHSLASRERARRVAYAPASMTVPPRARVLDLLTTARYPYQPPLSWRPSKRDIEAVEKSLSLLEVKHLVERELATLSSGELQRVLLAAALSREASILLVDEPTAFLDLRYKLIALEVLKKVARSGRLVVYATHELELAARYSDKMLLLHRGRIVAAGKPEEVLDPETVKKVYGVEVRVVRHPDHGVLVIPLRPV